MLTHTGMNETQVHIVGSGLAGSEAAYFLAERGVRVILHEMRPTRLTPAHKTGACAELVCSNSLKSKSPVSAPGMLKTEMRHLGSLILQAAERSEVPGGEALAVDRDLFAGFITDKIKNHPMIKWVEGEVSTPPSTEEPTLIATGPLTSESLSKWLAQATGEQDLYFYDAIAPIIDAQSIDRNITFLANRYDKGEELAYINCPFNEEQYYAFVDALLTGGKVAPKAFEQEKFFQGCQPIEAIAASGRDSLRFGPMKPVGLVDPKTGKRPYAVVQLRPENKALTAYNLVGFQTKLKYPEQTRIFRMIPGLEQAELLRHGSIHRNTYVCGPKVLRSDLSLRGHPKVYLAGQITGVEGYLESSACGLLAAMSIYQRLKGISHRQPPAHTALGSLLQYITGSDIKNYQPTNMNFALFDPRLFEGLESMKRDDFRDAMSKQAFENLKNWAAADGAILTRSTEDSLQRLEKKFNHTR